MNANRARPLLAFGLLALVAALITATGLREEVPPVEVRAGAPAPVFGTGASELLLGGLLQAQPRESTGGLPTRSGSETSRDGTATGSDRAEAPDGRSKSGGSTPAPEPVASDHAATVAETHTTVAAPGPGKSTQPHGRKAGSTVTSTARATMDATEVKGHQASVKEQTSVKEHGKSAK